MGVTPEEAARAYQDRLRLVVAAINDIQGLLNSNAFTQPGTPVFHASVVFGIVSLHDILQALSAWGKRISFQDDVEVPDRPGADVTDLISRCRNAACHLPSATRQWADVGLISFCVVAGKGVLLSTPQGDIANEFDDDTAVFWGNTRLYMRRHFYRAFTEARSALANA